ncbi:type VI secretion system ImpA family N-terminal domain-containing protein [Pseudomonas sp. ERGC3:01]|nr:type VI secretion system ImpA family N-terminal domain-containing protein [Pseudomonas sp. ERGC3:01]
MYVAQAIDWPHVESLCRGLYEQTLDLRVMVLLTRALLERCGLNDFLGGLRLVAWLVRQRWESVHPQLVWFALWMRSARTTNGMNPRARFPFLIARVRRVTTMSFIDIIEELAPNSVTDLRRLGGRVGD